MKKQEKTTKKRKYNFLYDFIKVTGLIPALIWVRPKIIRLGDKPKSIKGGALVVSNHVTYIDPIILHCALVKRRLYSVATKDIAQTKIRKFLFTVANCLFIDKEKFSMASLHEICDVLKQDKMVVIFPESTINKGDGVQGYKSGFVLMALLSKKPIVPICIIKRKHWYERYKIVIGEPIDVNSMCSAVPTMDEMNSISELLHKKEQEMLATYSDRK